MPRRLENQQVSLKQIITAGLVIFGFVLAALQQWYELKNRVTALERE